MHQDDRAWPPSTTARSHTDCVLAAATKSTPTQTWHHGARAVYKSLVRLLARDGKESADLCLSGVTYTMLLLALLTTSFLVSGPLASPLTQHHVVHEKRSSYPAGWTRRGELDKKAILPMRIALTQRNLDQAHQWLMDVSHPESEKYGQHWSAEEVAQAFAPRYSVTPDETGATSY